MSHLNNPYAAVGDGQWLRGNLHAHTTRSDGELSPQALIDTYVDNGYDFLAVSDHDKASDDALFADLDARGLILLPANEITANGPHMLHIGANETIEPLPDRPQVIGNALHSGGFIVVNHPNWTDNFDHCSLSNLMEWQGYSGIEVFNGVVVRLTGSHLATDKWDQLLSAGRRVWGYANDDMHAPQDVALGWNVVRVRERTRDAVMSALREGRFYASTGITVRSITCDGMKARIETEDAQRIAAVSLYGLRLAAVDAPVMEFELPEGLPYLRFECYGAAEKMAWSQPLFVEAD